MQYVTMTDNDKTLLSDDDKKIKRIFKCRTFSEAITVRENAINHPDMSNINIGTIKPPYDSPCNQDKYHTIWHSKEDKPEFYIQNAFKKHG